MTPGRPPVCKKPQMVKVFIEESLLEELDAIAASSAMGAIPRSAALRKAIEDYVAAHINDPAAQATLANRRGQPLRLVGEAGQTTERSTG